MKVKNNIDSERRGQGADTDSGVGNANEEQSAKSSRRTEFGRPGNCFCPNCHYKWPRQPGKPCYGIICPQCGSQMTKGL